MLSQTALIAVLLAFYAASSVHAILDQLEKYEIHKLSDHSHMNNAKNGRKLLQSRGERKLSYEFEAFGRVLALELTRDDELFAPDYKHYFVVPKDDGSHEYIVDENIDTKCHYKAIIKDDPQSIGRISLCGPGMRAMLRHSEIGQFHIEPIDEKGDEHAVYRALDVKKTNKNKCGVDNSHRINGPRGLIEDHSDMKSSAYDQHDHVHNLHHEKEAVEQTHERRELVNLPDKLIRLMVVNDYLRFQQMGSSTHTHAASLIALMDILYSTIGGGYTFKLQIVGMMTFSIKDPYSVTISSSGYPFASNILSPFTSWASSKSTAANFPVQYSSAVLFSGYNFDGSTIGLAWMGTICKASSKMNIVQTYDLTDAVISVAAAHELGHNLGMEHDDISDPDSLVPTACFNSSSPHIMDPSVSGGGSVPWSTCSPNWVKMQLEGYNTKYPKRYDVTNYPACMEKCYIGDANPPAGCVGVATRNESIPVCGDGFREGSEECDCPNKDCTNVDPCCDGATCKLKVGSACSVLDPCCSSSCQIVADTSQVCRAATGECDVTEMCDGVNAKCPTDDFLQIGSPCTVYSKAGTCYNKVCLSHYGQCTDTGGLDTYDSGCPTRDFDNGDVSCSNLFCRPTGQTGCIYYLTIYVKDGTQCSSNKACMNKVCTPYSSFPNQPTTTVSPTKNPTKRPTVAPTKNPTLSPTKSPIPPTSNPTKSPTQPTTLKPTTSNPTTSIPTKNPLVVCNYPNKKKCKKDILCTWKKNVCITKPK